MACVDVCDFFRVMMMEGSCLDGRGQFLRLRINALFISSSYLWLNGSGGVLLLNDGGDGM